jgi:small-conductance mechanosensitive channel
MPVKVELLTLDQPLPGLTGQMPAWIRRLEAALRPEYWEGVLWAIGIAVAALLIGRVIAWAVVGLFERWSRLTHTLIDDVAIKHLAQPLRWLLPFLALTVALPGLGVSERAYEVIHQIVLVIIILIVGWLFFRVVQVLEEVLGMRLTVDGAIRPEARANYTQLRSFRNIAGFLIALVTLGLALLSFTGVRQIGASMLASAGVAGVVLGFAAQRSISTLVSGLVLAVAQPIRLEDYVVVEGESGVVEEITLTYVVVRLSDQRRIVLPINHFLERPFENWSRGSPELVGRVLLYLDYSAPVEAIRAELKRILEASKFWDRRTWRLFVSDANDKTIVLRAQMSAKDPDAAWELRCEVREQLIATICEKYPYALPVGRNQTAEEAERSASDKTRIDG